MSYRVSRCGMMDHKSPCVMMSHRASYMTHVDFLSLIVAHYNTWWLIMTHYDPSCLRVTHYHSWRLIVTHSDSHYGAWCLLGLRNDWNWNWFRNTCMGHVDDLICLHKSLIVVLWWYESFFVLRHNGNVISKSLRNHDVIDIVTRIVCIMRYESSNRETIFFNWFSMKIYLTSL